MEWVGGDTTDSLDGDSKRDDISRRRVLQTVAGVSIGSLAGALTTGTASASHAGNYVYSAGRGEIEVHKTTPDGEFEWRYTGPSSTVYDVAVDADDYVYSASGGNELHKISPDGDGVWQYTEHSDTLRGVAVDADQYVYSISFDGEVHKIAPTGETVWRYTGHSGEVYSIALDGQGHVYSARGSDGTLHKITTEGEFEWAYTGHSDSVYDLAMDSEGNVYTASGDATVHKVSPEGEAVWQYTGHGGTIWSVAVDGTGSVHSGGQGDREVHKISPEGEAVWQYTEHSDDVRELSVDSEGYVYSTSDDSELHKIAPDGTQVWQYTGHGGGVRGSAVDNEYTAAFGFPLSASFDITTVETNSPVEAGEVLEVTVDIENTGDTSETQTLTLDIDGQETETAEVSLAGGETTAVTLTWNTGEDDVGTVGITVETDDDTAETDTTVLEPAQFGLELTGTNEPVVEGDTLEVTVAVENTGGASDTQTLTLDTDGQERDTLDTSLDGGETEAVTLQWDTGVDDAGSYQLLVESDDDSDEATLTVHTTAGFLVALTDTNGPVEAGETLEVTVTVENTGEEEDTQDIILEINGEQLDTKSITLDSGESQELTFDWTAENRNAVGVRVASEDDADNEHVSLTPEADEAGEAAIEIIGANTPVSEGDTLEVDVELTNTGEEELTQDVDFDVDGHHEETREVTLGPDETTVETFTWTVDHRTSVGVRAAGADDWDNTYLLLANDDFTPPGF